jgi:cytoskeletal protein RodZ
MVAVGQRLYRERIQRKLTLEDIAKATKIKASFLAAIEKGEYSKLPSPAYAQGFVRNYAAFLGLSKPEMTALFRREFDEKKAYKVLPDSLTKTQEFSLSRIKMQQSLLPLAAVLLLILAYLSFQYRAVVIAPSLSLSSPKQNAISSQEITVSGKADSNATVLVNNQPVSLASDGAFTKQITVFPGKSEIVVRAKNRFGKETIVRRSITVKQ